MKPYRFKASLRATVRKIYKYRQGNCIVIDYNVADRVIKQPPYWLTTYILCFNKMLWILVKYFGNFIYYPFNPPVLLLKLLLQSLHLPKYCCISTENFSVVCAFSLCFVKCSICLYPEKSKFNSRFTKYPLH